MNWRKWLGFKEEEVEREIQTHLELEREERIAAGATETEAQGAARKAFGNPVLTREDVRAVWRSIFLERWMAEWKLGFRSMRRRPGFASALILTIALGIGASCTMFALIDAVLLKPLPFAASDRLTAVNERRLRSGDEARVSPGRLEDWNRSAQSFQALTGAYPDSGTETSGEVAERLPVLFAAPRFFSVFRADPVVGRVFDPAEEQPGGAKVVVISHALWQRKFGGRPDVVGRALRLEGEAQLIVGVMPRDFQIPDLRADVWIPKQATAELLKIRQARFYRVFGVLKAGVPVAQARAELDGIQQSLGERYPETDAGAGTVVRPLKETLVGKVKTALWIVFGAVGLLLLIACANAGSLFLVQASRRASELATRTALGAGSSSVARLLLAEGLAYATAGALLGLSFAYTGVQLLKATVRDLPRVAEMEVDGRVAAFAAILSLVTGALFSLSPILHVWRRDVASSLRSGGRTTGEGGRRLSTSLVAIQFVLATVLLIGAGLWLRTLSNLRADPLGFKADNVLAFRVSSSFREEIPAVMQRHLRTFRTIAEIPGVRSVAATLELPGIQAGPTQEFKIAGAADIESLKQSAAIRTVTADYFTTMKIPLVAGRTCTQDPNSVDQFQTLVNRAFVDRYFPGRDPVGRSIMMRRPLEIVGVAGNVREEGFGRAPEPLIYVCGLLRFWPDPYFIVETQAGVESIIPAVRRKLQELEPQRAVYEVRPLTDALWDTLGRFRFQSYLITLFSAMALILASLGLYGVMSYLVVQRTREFGLRSALGARPGQIMSQILREGARVGMLGGVLGLIAAVPASAILRASLYGVETFDAGTYALVASILALVSVGACLIPGFRAISIDPSRALRSE